MVQKQVGEQPASSFPESLEEEIARLKAGSLQGAKRDEEVANEIDRVTEDLDVESQRISFEFRRLSANSLNELNSNSQRPASCPHSF